MLPFSRVTVIGLGLIGSSICRAVRAYMPTARVTGHDADPQVREIARRIDLCDDVTDTAGASVIDADLVILCVPVGAMGRVAAAIADDLPADAIVSDVGGAKASVLAALREALPDAVIVPGHPVAGTEFCGPESGFASLFKGRWCIITPDADTPAVAILRVRTFWEAFGANVEEMTPEHHDLVLAVTSHVPHLIAYTIVGTASDLEAVTQSEVIKYSAGGFRDFTRIAASDPTMWRDVFLNNREAVLEVMQRLTEDLNAMQKAIRYGDGDALFAAFARTRAIRRSIIEQGQDDAKPDFGRIHEDPGVVPPERPQTDEDTWLRKIVAAVIQLGGEAKYDELHSQLEKAGSRALTVNQKNYIRNLIRKYARTTAGRGARVAIFIVDGNTRRLRLASSINPDELL